MKKILLVAAAATTMLAFSCNPKDDKGTDKEGKTLKEDNTADDEEGGSSDIKKAAVGYCECFNNNYGDIDPKIKKMLIKAGNSDDPMTTIQQEAMKISDPEEQQKISEEMQKMSNDKDMEACAKKLNKKYGLDENDKKTQRSVMKVLQDEEDCELLAALMKIGLAQSNNTMNSDGQDEDAPRTKRPTTDDEQ